MIKKVFCLLQRVHPAVRRCVRLCPVSLHGRRAQGRRGRAVNGWRHGRYHSGRTRQVTLWSLRHELRLVSRPPTASSSSLSLACPDIWSRRNDFLFTSSMLPCLLCCPLPVPTLCYLGYKQLFTLVLAALFFCPLVCPHLAFLSLCASSSS